MRKRPHKGTSSSGCMHRGGSFVCYFGERAVDRDWTGATFRGTCKCPKMNLRSDEGSLLIKLTRRNTGEAHAPLSHSLPSPLPSRAWPRLHLISCLSRRHTSPSTHKGHTRIRSRCRGRAHHLVWSRCREEARCGSTFLFSARVSCGL
jgi:hypothetical protein